MAAYQGDAGERPLVIAIDGKTVRGAKNREGKAPHLVAALAHGIGAVLGQVAVQEKSNEIPAVRELLKAFADLAGAVFTLDAMHTQHDTAQAILGRQADYVMTVKANMPPFTGSSEAACHVPAVSALARIMPPRPPHYQDRAAPPDRVHAPPIAQLAHVTKAARPSRSSTSSPAPHAPPPSAFPTTR